LFLIGQILILILFKTRFRLLNLNNSSLSMERLHHLPRQQLLERRFALNP